MLRLSQKKRNMQSAKPPRIDPTKEAGKIIFLYVVLGILWILVSDEIMFRFVEQPDNLYLFSLVKGLVYVQVTGIVFFIIVFHRIKIIHHANESLYKSHASLERVNKALKKKEHELEKRAYYDVLTGLPNMEYLRMKSQKSFLQAGRTNMRIALLYADKMLNIV